MQSRTLSLLLLVGIVAAPSDAAAPPKAADARQIAQLVAQLGDDDFTTRERAERTLLAIGGPAVPTLVKALSDADPEVRRRALVVARAIEARTAALFTALGADVYPWNEKNRRVDILSFDQRDASRLRDEHLRQLLGFPWLKRIWLNGAPVGDAVMPYIGQFKKLEYLVLGTRVSDAGLVHLAGLTNLEVLSLGDTKVTGPGLVHLKAMERLHTLDLDNSRLTDAGLAAGVCGIKGLKSLRLLGLSGTQIGNAGLATAVDGLEELRSLRCLDLAGTRVTDAGLGCLRRLKQPMYIDLAGTRLTDKGIARLRTLRNLRCVDLSRTAVTDEGCAQLAQIRTLEKIVLEQTRVTVAGLRQFKDLPRLKCLSIRGLKLSEKEIKRLVEVFSEGVLDYRENVP